MSKGKIIGIGAVIVLLVIAGLFIFTLSNLDAIVKQVVEKAGTHVTKTDVRLADVKIGLTDGSGALKGLRVQNPKGFSSAPIFSLGNISVKLDTSTLTQDPIVIQEVMINEPKVLYEVDSKGKSNLDALKANVAQMTKGSGDGGSSASGGDSQGPKVVIRKLVIDGGQADIKLNALLEKEMTAKMPRIQLNNIGQKSGGATPAEIGEKIITAMTGSLSKVVSTAGVEKLINQELGKQLKGVTDKAEKALTEGAGKLGGDAAKEAGEALKGILGN